MDFQNLSYKTIIVTVNSETDVSFFKKRQN